MTTDDATPTRSRIFISYRREDTQQAVGRLAEDLGKHFSREQVFDDITSIVPGADFVDALYQGLDTCAALLVVIGPRWLTAADHHGRRRLDVPGDWVRQEVAESLRHPGVRVFPLLVDDAQMPSEEELPEDLRPLVRRQAFVLTARHWPSDVERLVEFLRSVPGLAARGPAGAPPQAKVSWKLVTAVAALLVLATAVSVYFTRTGRAPARLPSPVAETPLSKQAVETPVSEPAVETSKPAAKAATDFKVGETFRDCDRCPEMVVIPGGAFAMGSFREAARGNDEGPQHGVTLARKFAVGKYEVTFDEWDAYEWDVCVATGVCPHRPSDNGWGRGRQPVIFVSWNDAQAYIAWLSNKSGQRYRLLSEAEWEYAARAGASTAYPWGDEPGTNRANLKDSGSQWSGKQPAPVGSFEANRFGLHDMIGNVHEWVQDCYHDAYTGAPLDGRAWEKGNCQGRVRRGGSWQYPQVLGRAATRGWVRSSYASTLQVDDTGFRVARDL